MIETQRSTRAKSSMAEPTTQKNSSKYKPETHFICAYIVSSHRQSLQSLRSLPDAVRSFSSLYLRALFPQLSGPRIRRPAGPRVRSLRLDHRIEVTLRSTPVEMILALSPPLLRALLHHASRFLSHCLAQYIVLAVVVGRESSPSSSSSSFDRLT